MPSVCEIESSDRADPVTRTVCVRVLGLVEIHHGRKVLGIGPPQPRRVLTALAVDAGRPVMTDTLVDRVWGEAPDRARRGSQVHLTRIRRRMEQSRSLKVAFAGPVRWSDRYLLDIDPDWVDLHRFVRLVGRAGEPQRPNGEWFGLLCEALSLWHGQPLTGVRGQRCISWVART